MSSAVRLAAIRERNEAVRRALAAIDPVPVAAPVTFTLPAEDLQFIRGALAAVSGRRVMCPRSRRRARLLVETLTERGR